MVVTETVKITVAWNVTLFSLIDIYLCFGWIEASILEVGEASVNFYQSAWCHTSETVLLKQSTR